MDNISTILKDKSLSVTESRREILSLFLKSDGALAHADIERHMPEKTDRVTIYRTLQTFVEKGIIHQVPTTDNNVLYAMCRHDHAGHGHHLDDHVHFICNNCEATICLDDVLVPQVKLPEKFMPLSSAMVVHGICEKCGK